jgi:hypothetical protein
MKFGILLNNINASRCYTERDRFLVWTFYLEEEEEFIIKERDSAPPRQVKKFDRATRDIIRDRESSRFQVVVEGQLQMMEENGLRVCVGAWK